MEEDREEKKWRLTVQVLQKQEAQQARRVKMEREKHQRARKVRGECCKERVLRLSQKSMKA